MADFTDTVTAFKGGAAEPSRGIAPRRAYSESFGRDGGEAKASESSTAERETVRIGNGHAARELSESSRKMLANLDAHGSVGDEPEVEEVAAPVAAPVVAAPVTPVAAPAPVVTVATPAAVVPPVVDPSVEHIARADRLTEHNRKLVAELETLRARPARGEPSQRDKHLDEAERGYVEDPIASIRRLIATAIGADDPKSKDVDSELSGLYQDLTERELGVSLDSSAKSLREAARTRRLLERDKRDRKAEAATPAAPADDTAGHVALIGTRLAVRGDDGKTLGERHPLLVAHAADLDGMAAPDLLLRVIRQGFASGEYDPATPDTRLIEAAASKIETHYKALVEKLGGARTATPETQAPAATENKVGPQGTGAKTITNVSASVAPATPPAVKPAPEAKPPYRNEAERRKALAAKYFG